MGLIQGPVYDTLIPLDKMPIRNRAIYPTPMEPSPHAEASTGLKDFNQSFYVREETTEELTVSETVVNSWRINDKKIGGLKYGGHVGQEYHSRGTMAQKTGANPRPVSPKRTVVKADEEIFVTHCSKKIDVVNFDHYYRQDTSNDVSDLR